MTNVEEEKVNCYKKQKAIIDSLPEPVNDYERVDYNTWCISQTTQNGIKRIVIDFISTLAIIPFLILYSFNRLLYSRKQKKCWKTIIIESCNRKGMQYDFKGRVPDFDESYSPILELKLGAFPPLGQGVIGWGALKIFTHFLWRHPWEGFINLRCLVNLMGYYRLIYLYSPCTIVNSRMELNSLSSLITHLCEKCGCEFVCFMHGEVMTNIHTAFVRFSKFYIWDKHYIDVFNWSRCASNQYVIYQPKIYVFSNTTVKPRYNITYYLTGNELTGYDIYAPQIAEVLTTLSQYGYKCKVRPHPRWSNMEQISRLFQETEIDIESCKDVSVTDSIYDSEIVAGTFSTVLAQAYYCGKKVYIDDVTNKKMLEELRERKYFLLSKEVGMLSELLNNSK